MPTWRRIFRFRRADVAASVDEELRFHFQARAAELRARGLTPAEVERTIAEEFGDVEATRRRLYAIGERLARRRDRLRWWHEVRTDLAYAVRGLRRQPAFAAAALLTLAVGIGATTAMLSIARAALIGSVPFPHSERLVMVWESRPQNPGERIRASYPEFLEWREGSRAFAALEGYDGTNVTLTGGCPAQTGGCRARASRPGSSRCSASGPSSAAASRRARPEQAVHRSRW
jgi:hypothetical protein